MVTSPGTRQKARHHILDQLEMPKQVVADAIKQRITVVQATGYLQSDWVWLDGQHWSFGLCIKVRFQAAFKCISQQSGKVLSDL